MLKGSLKRILSVTISFIRSRRCWSAFMDLTFTYSLAYLIFLLVVRMYDVGFFLIFSVTLVFYFAICNYFLNGQTLAKRITGIRVVTKNNQKLGLFAILVREVFCKYFLMVAIPFYLINQIRIFENAHPPTAIQITGIYFAILAIPALIGFLLFQKTWWEWLSSTRTIHTPFPEKRSRLFLPFLVFMVTYCLVAVIKLYPFFDAGKHIKTTFFPEYPSNDKAKKYAEFILSQQLKPVDYIFHLYDHYDLVVLCERMHPEYTQYEFLFSLISDKRFASRIGNIYTEIGSISYQDSLNRYLNTTFPNDDSLNRATAGLLRNCNSLWPLWPVTGLYDLLKLVNKLNNGKPDSLKINWYFTDIPVNWSKMTATSYALLPRKEKRDKIMADHIIEQY